MKHKTCHMPPLNETQDISVLPSFIKSIERETYIYMIYIYVCNHIT